MFTLIKPSATEATFDLEGGIYVLDKSEDNWTARGVKDLDGGKKISSTEFQSTFPTVGNALGLSGDADVNTNWGFITGAESLNSLCKSGVSDSNCNFESISSQEFKGS